MTGVTWVLLFAWAISAFIFISFKPDKFAPKPIPIVKTPPFICKCETQLCPAPIKWPDTKDLQLRLRVCKVELKEHAEQSERYLKHIQRIRAECGG